MKKEIELPVEYCKCGEKMIPKKCGEYHIDYKCPKVSIFNFFFHSANRLYKAGFQFDIVEECGECGEVKDCDLCKSECNHWDKG